MSAKFKVPSLERSVAPAVLAGWRWPSRQELMTISVLGFVLGVSQLWRVLLFVPYALLVLTPCGVWCAWNRQDAPEGALLLATVLAAGGSFGVLTDHLVFDHHVDLRLDEFWIPFLMFFFLGLGIAPVGIALSRRRLLLKVAQENQ